MANWNEGDQVDWTNPETNETKKAIVDAVVDARSIRIMILDTYEIEWVHPGELKPLDIVSQIGRLEGAKTLEEQLAEIEAEEGEDG